MRRWLTIVLLLPAFAAADDTADDDVALTVKPLLCITDNRNPHCELSFLVMWESTSSGYYCLFNDFEESSLRCWQQQREGRLTDERSVDGNFSFWLTGEDLASRLAQVDIEVLRLDSDDRRRKRRTRHVWDIN